VTKRSLVPVVSLLGPTVAAAQSDHLKCYKIKYPAARAIYTADLNGLTPETGCQIKVPGQLLCVGATKTNVTPTPPGGGPEAPVGRFVCYKLRCPSGTPPPVVWHDQFGTRNVQPTKPTMVCAPEVVSTTTTRVLPSARRRAAVVASPRVAI